ncbi:MAG: hypothetical protein H0W83_00230 [Planctomycetes bacterium]|nr:hypothetical protein [Planctomycetota bacterium]
MDGSSDILSALCRRRALELFRFNVDRYLDYAFLWEPEGFIITDSTGRCLRSSEVAACYWRKPFIDADASSTSAWARAQVQYVVREMANWCMARGLLRLVEPDAERRFGKLMQMDLAQLHFSVPGWTVGWNQTWPPGVRVVKSLASQLLDDGGFLFTRAVDPSHLAAPHPWFVQDVAEGIHDATVLYIAGKVMGFRIDHPRRPDQVDWRTSINVEDTTWVRWELPGGMESAVVAFMGDAGLRFGRLDFIVGDVAPHFLEVNTNGQYGWLDNESFTIHNAILDAIMDRENAVMAASPPSKGLQPENKQDGLALTNKIV